MAHRIDVDKAAPGAVRAIFGLEEYVTSSGLEPSLMELAKLQASEMNGCAYCVDERRWASYRWSRPHLGRLRYRHDEGSGYQGRASDGTSDPRFRHRR